MIELAVVLFLMTVFLGIYQATRPEPQEEITIPICPEEKKVTKFCDIKEQLIEALEKALPLCGLEEERGFSLLDGFVCPIVYRKLEPDYILVHGPIIPMVMIIGNKSGQIYYFALKKLLPDIEI